VLQFLKKRHCPHTGIIYVSRRFQTHRPGVDSLPAERHFARLLRSAHPRVQLQRLSLCRQRNGAQDTPGLCTRRMSKPGPACGEYPEGRNHPGRCEPVLPWHRAVASTLCLRLACALSLAVSAHARRTSGVTSWSCLGPRGPSFKRESCDRTLTVSASTTASTSSCSSVESDSFMILQPSDCATVLNSDTIRRKHTRWSRDASHNLEAQTSANHEL
jgi:hypothetical protein